MKNKSTFFAELNHSIAKLPKAKREDILRDMEEHFYEGQKRGLSEEEITEKLGSAKKIADTMIMEAKVECISKATTIPQKIAAIISATIAILVLAPISFVFVFFPLLFIVALLCGLWPIAFILIIALPFILIAVGFTMFQIGFHVIALLCLLFFALGWGSMVFAVIIGLSIFTILLFQGVIALFRWNINFIKKQMRSE